MPDDKSGVKDGATVVGQFDGFIRVEVRMQK